jgi:hypothetical protein
MSGTRIVSGSIAVLMLASLMLSASSMGEGLDVEIGDYWKYSMDMEDDGLTITGDLEMKVDRTGTLGGQDIFILELSGSGEVSGSYEGATASGSMDITGVEKRLMSDFDVVSEDITMTMDLDVVVVSMSMEVGFIMSYSPSMDDFIGDNDMTLNSEVTSTYSATAEYWTNVLGMEDSDSETMSGETTMTVVQESVSVTVPAGTFDCCKVKVDTTMNGSTETEYWYYSDEVGFYVKRDMGNLGAGELELEEYNTGEGGISMFTGDNLWLTILIIVVVVVIVAVAIAMRSRRGKMPTPMTPPQPDTQIPPPPGPGEPGMPPVDPTQPPQNPPTG